MRHIPQEYEFFKNHSKVDYLWEDTSCEIVFFHHVMQEVLKNPIAQDHQFYILNEEQLPREGDDVIAIQIGLEDHRIPEYSDRVGLVFTTYPPRGEMPSNVKNIPLGYNGDLPEVPLVAFDDRNTAVYFSGQNSNERWKIGAAIDGLKKQGNHLSEHFEINYSQKFRTGITPRAYAHGLMNAKIALAPRGTQSPITFRFFEAARAGNVIVTCRLPETWYFEKFPGIQIDDWGKLDQTLDELLNDKNGLESIHQKTLSYYQNYCSAKAVANYIVEQIKER